ncbi:MAG: winged helix-turn-helix transcriptional regulator [Thermoplasmata archaeon]|nr:winged helix-turn-helix transcriptional regulator [Thermoplasmata archaeon]
MNREETHLKRILILALTVALFAGFVQGRAPVEEADTVSYDLVLSGRDEEPEIRMDVTKFDPQPNSDHWSIWIRIEEKEEGIWDKTSRNVTTQLIRYNNTEEEIIINMFWPNGGNKGIFMDLSYDLPEGNYTVRAGVEIDGNMTWMKDIISIPYSSLPPHAVANLILNNERLKVANLILNRDHEASIILDASESWDPDENESELLNFTWEIGDTLVTINKETLTWTFTEPGDYNITLTAKDPEGLWSQDNVTVHVEEISYIPDLEITLEGDREKLELGESLHLTAIIHNNGNEDAWGFDVYFYDWKGIFTNIQNIGLIPMGMNRTLSIDYFPTTVGLQRILAVVDPFNETEESNEENNEASFDIEVIQKVLPELSIQTLDYNGSLEVNKTINITIVIQNNGPKDAFNLKVYLYINEGVHEGVPMEEWTFDSIEQGKTVTIDYYWIPRSTGLYTAHVELWVNSTIHDNGYLRDMDVVDPERENSGENGSPPIILYATTGGLVLIALGAVGVLGFENTKYKLLGSLVMTPFYTRLKREDTLNHQTRARVYEHILDNPGDSYASILKTLDLKNGTLVHHLRTLERQRYVKSKKDGKFKRFYPWGTKVGIRDPNFLTDIQSKIVDIIKSNPGISQAHIANMLGKSRQSINYQVRILRDAGLINVVKHGISTRCYRRET